MALTSDSGLKPPAAPSFDRVLIDAPCSNTGVMRRRVDLRWRLRPPEIERLQQTQIQLLTEATRLLRPGGTLVYSTCSLEPEENEQVVQAAIQNGAPLVLGQERQLTPFENGVDGAYVAQLKRQ
jgi:16S rRNA (cytosine967-C5)-methyltransferase